METVGLICTVGRSTLDLRGCDDRVHILGNSSRPSFVLWLCRQPIGMADQGSFAGLNATKAKVLHHTATHEPACSETRQ